MTTYGISLVAIIGLGAAFALKRAGFSQNKIVAGGVGAGALTGFISRAVLRSRQPSASEVCDLIAEHQRKMETDNLLSSVKKQNEENVEFILSKLGYSKVEDLAIKNAHDYNSIKSECDKQYTSDWPMTVNQFLTQIGF